MWWIQRMDIKEDYPIDVSINPNNTVFDQPGFKTAFAMAYPEKEYFLLNKYVNDELKTVLYFQKEWGIAHLWWYPRCDYHTLNIDSSDLDIIKGLICEMYWNIEIYLSEIPYEIYFLNAIKNTTIYKIRLWKNLFESISNKNFCMHIRQKYNKLNKKRITVDYKSYKDVEQIKSLLPILFDMHMKRWHNTTTPSQFNDSRNRDLYFKLAEDDTINTEMNVLFLNGNIAALHFGFFDSKEFYYYKSIYDLNFWEFSPGIILICEIIKDCINRNIEIFDFLRGEEEYKKRFSNFQTKNFFYKV